MKKSRRWGIFFVSEGQYVGLLPVKNEQLAALMALSNSRLRALLDVFGVEIASY